MRYSIAPIDLHLDRNSAESTLRHDIKSCNQKSYTPRRVRMERSVAW